MKITIIAIGKLREPFWRDAAGEYVKRLSRFGPVEIVECPDIAEPKNASDADIRKIVEMEGRSVLEKLQARDHVVALCIEGRQMSSPALAGRVQTIEASGAARLVFVIGGSNGLSEKVIQRAQERLSFSPMTFPHQLARVMLLEQIYRARKLNANEAYHK